MSTDITDPVYAYTDGHGHRIQLLTTSDMDGRPYVWVDAEDLAIGGAYASMWLTIEQAALLGDAIDTHASASFTDHTGDFLVIEPGDPHTVITVTRDPGDYDPGVVRVVVLTGRLPELRAALKATAERAVLRAAAVTEPTEPEAVLDPADPWATIARLTAWLDDHNGSSTPETALRLMKVQEEAGEVAAAWIGVVGQNPRKGVTHDVADVLGELCDVIVAAMVAMATLTRDPGARFAAKLAGIAALRLDTTDGES